jgi:hypothetical protein
VMKAPIWYLLDRFSSLTGGGGFHRAALLDAAFQHLDHWWLMGMPILETSRWLPYTNTNTGAVDMTNHFLVFGITAGLGAILLLIAVLRAAFSALGRSLALARLSGPAKSDEILLWGLGVALAVHIFNWFSITYWDQLNVVWILHIACVGSLASRAPQTTTGADIELKDGNVYGGA